MSRKPRLLLLDAGAIFAAMHHQAWDALVEAYEVLVPATIVRVEAIFFIDRGGQRHEMDLGEEVASGRIGEVEVDAGEIADVAAQFSVDFRERLDAGELEALAYLMANEAMDLRFVSADGPAIQAVAMLDPDMRVCSLEEALDACGWSKPLDRRFSREFVKENLQKGSIRKIQGRGLVE